MTKIGSNGSLSLGSNLAKILQLCLQEMDTKTIPAKDVLKFIGLGTLVVSSLAFPCLPIAISKLNKQWKNANISYLGRVIKRYEKQQLIRISEKENTIEIELTEKGRVRILEFNFENIDVKNKIHEGKFWFIVFDIPNIQKLARDKFREKLIQLGFSSFQESVYVSPFPCKEEIDFLCHYLQISKYVTVIKMDKIERGEKIFFKKFSLNDK
jgi:hypothetical protein